MHSLNILGVIPARFASSRFPGKPLALIQGKSMIQRVYEQCMRTSIAEHIVVATDDKRIVDHVIGFGGKAIMTSAHHPSGTDRCLEAALEYSKTAVFSLPDVVVNIQGDEPLIDPQNIDLLVEAFADHTVDIATLGTPFSSVEQLNSPNSVKIVRNIYENALYFSRAVVPFLRNSLQTNEDSFSFLKHIGIYGYRMQVLSQICKISPSSLETAESLEQLRWLENGYSIRVKICKSEGLCVDVPEDIQTLEQYMISQNPPIS